MRRGGGPRHLAGAGGVAPRDAQLATGAPTVAAPAAEPPARERSPLRRTARPLAAWAVVVPLAAWLVVRATGVGGGSWIETAMVLTPFAALASALALGVVAALRVWPALAGAAVTCVGFGLVMGPLFAPGPRPSPAPGGPVMTVMTVNVQFGLADAAQVVRLVDEADVALLAVQELTPEFDAAVREAGLDDLLPHDVVEPRGGAGGSGLYSRFPVRRVADDITGAHRSPTGLVAVPAAVPVQVSVVHPVPPVGDEGMTQWRATFRSFPRPGGEPLAVDGPRRARERPDDPRTHLLLGDFNATVDQPTMRGLLDDGYVDAAGAVGRGWVTTWRFPFTPPLAIDHVLVDGSTGVRSVDVHRITGSDHRALVATVRLAAG